MKKGNMAGVITYECIECGCEIIVTGAEESQIRPIYCCGTEVVKISSSLKKMEAKRSEKKTATKKKAVKKTSVPRNNSGG